MARLASGAAALIFIAGILLWGCTQPPLQQLPVHRETAEGDREREWALVYFQSWRQNRDGQYLVLSRRHMASAVQTWFELQVKIGHSFPEFYVLDRRRRRGCQFLEEIDRLALKFEVPLLEPQRTGCFKGA